MLHTQLTRIVRWRKQVYLGWWVLVGVMLLQVMVSGIFFQGFGVYVPILIEEFGWSATTISLVVSGRQVVSAIAAPGIGFALDRFGARRVIATGLVTMSIGYVLFSQVQTLWFFVAAQLLLGFAANLSGWLPSNKLLINWFVKRRTMSLAFMGMGMSIGGLLTPFMAKLINVYGWRPIAVGSGAMMFLALLLIPLLRSSPEAYGLEPDGFANADGKRIKPSKLNSIPPPSTVKDDFTVQEAIRTRSFWLIAIGHALALVSVVAVLVHLIAHMSNGLGFSLETAASVFALVTGVQIFGQLFSGFFADRFSKHKIAAGAMLFHAVAMFIFAVTEAMPIILLAAVLHGVAWGVRGPLMSALRADYYGRTHFGKIMGFADPIVILGALIGPVIAGYSFDNFGSYSTAFFILGFTALVGSICFALATQPKKPQV